MIDDDATCPICDTEIETTRKVGEVTHELDPCGHQVDEAVHQDLVDE